MGVMLREMTVQDYEEVLALWRSSEGIGLSDADSRENIARFLERNPGLSFVAYDGQELIGAVLCGYDGRRGYIHHLAVAESHRRRRLGREWWDDACPPLSGRVSASAISLYSATIRTPSPSGRRSPG